MHQVCAYIRHVGNGAVAWLPYNPYGEFCFESWLIKTGEGRTSKGGFKLGRRQDSEARKTNFGISLFHIQACSRTFPWERAAHSPDLPTAGAVAAFVETMEAVRQVGSKPQQNLVPPTFGQEGV